ncbi:hypothetical protein NEFER02_0833 [Nematocida sp. LUAm2]|nr:hypothetical protein NEFER02_0833 [Nematocida sp. LUAm2]
MSVVFFFRGVSSWEDVRVEDIEEMHTISYNTQGNDLYKTIRKATEFLSSFFLKEEENDVSGSYKGEEIDFTFNRIMGCYYIETLKKDKKNADNGLNTRPGKHPRAWNRNSPESVGSDASSNTPIIEKKRSFLVNSLYTFSMLIIWVFLMFGILLGMLYSSVVFINNPIVFIGIFFLLSFVKLTTYSDIPLSFSEKLSLLIASVSFGAGCIQAVRAGDQDLQIYTFVALGAALVAIIITVLLARVQESKMKFSLKMVKVFEVGLLILSLAIAMACILASFIYIDILPPTHIFKSGIASLSALFFFCSLALGSAKEIRMRQASKKSNANTILIRMLRWIAMLSILGLGVTIVIMHYNGINFSPFPQLVQ